MWRKERRGIVYVLGDLSCPDMANHFLRVWNSRSARDNNRPRTSEPTTAQITIDVLHPDLADDAVHVSQRLPAVYSVTDGVGWSSSTASIGVFKFVFSCKWPWRTFSALQRTNRRGILPKDNAISRTILLQREATKKVEDTCSWWVCPFAKWHVLAFPEYSIRFQCNVMQCFLWVYLIARIAQLVDWWIV